MMSRPNRLKAHPGTEPVMILAIPPMVLSEARRSLPPLL